MELSFQVKSGLKSIIGNDLILDDFIAVYELVKNSYDAHATNVKIIFDTDNLIIWDNGKGMNIDDIKNKWLAVAYSAKKEGEEDDDLQTEELKDYREKIIPAKYFAGAKGIGRFSSDRLGKELILTSKKASRGSKIEQLAIDWEAFELKPKQRFETIRPTYINKPDISRYPKFTHGTVLEIKSLRSPWPRKKILELKYSLEKLINPFDTFDPTHKTTVSNARKFTIDIISERDHSADKNESSPREKVNGPVHNFIFETLSVKTTKLFAEISRDGKTITTELIDRGKLVYRIREKNIFSQLSDIRVHLYYLNFAAKHNFKRQMGIENVKFGSVFLYKNGFRIYPFGEEGVDTFNIDRRKQQGYARYLGTRDLLGRIEIFGNDDKFQETSSRDGGLKQTEAYFQFIDFFMKRCFGRLERYVVDVNWYTDDKEKEDTSQIEGDFDAKNRIISLINKLIESNDVVLESYGKELIDIVDDKIRDDRDVPSALEELEKLGSKTKDKAFVQQLRKARKEYIQLKEKKDKADTKAREEEEARLSAERELELEKQRTTYLLATRKTLSDDAEGLIHNIVITTKAITANVDTLIEKIREGTIKEGEILRRLSTIKFNSDKAQKISKLITRANFKTQAEKQITDLAKFTEQYIAQYNDIYESEKINFKVTNINKASLVRKVNVLELSMIFDNLISNAEKAGAKKIAIEIKNSKDEDLIIIFSDDGKGIDLTQFKDVERIFELGVTTTEGSGIGLNHVKESLKKINGDIKFVGNGKQLKGATFEITIQ